MVRVIPVLDIMSGKVVRAVAGRREEYKPLSESVLIADPDPGRLLIRLKELGFSEVYIADLDSIMGRGRNPDVLGVAVDLGFSVLADVGARGLVLSDSPQLTYVLGTEYLEDLSQTAGRALSLDVRGGKVLFKRVERSISDVAEEVSALEPKLVLLIFLDRVGTLSGIDLDAVRVVRSGYGGRLVVGGGIRGVDDVIAAGLAGADAVLVATALHRGEVTRPEY